MISERDLSVPSREGKSNAESVKRSKAYEGCVPTKPPLVIFVVTIDQYSQNLLCRIGDDRSGAKDSCNTFII